MQLTPEQEVRLGNFGEQLASIRTNIEVANKDLEAIFKKKDEESVAFELRLREHWDTMQKLRKEKEEMLDFIVTERASLAGDIRKLESDKKDFAVYKMESISAIETAKASLETERNQSAKELNSLKESIRSLNSEVEALGSRVIELSHKEKELLESLDFLVLATRTAEDDVKYFESQRDSTIALADKEIKAKQQELMSVEARVQEEIKKIEIPYTTLMNERQAFENYRTDVRVLYDRANRMWQAMYPGKSLEDILTKQ